MKKIFMISCLMFMALGATVKAQETDKKKYEQMSLGVKAGLNYSNVWDGEGQDFRADSKAGVAAGLFFGIPVGKFLGFQPEILVSQKGFRASGTLLNEPYSFRRTTTYVDIPLQLMIRPIKFLTIVGGPQYSFLLAEKNAFTLGEITIVQEEEFQNDNIRKNILGLVAGADFTISHLVVSGRVGWDMIDNHGDGNSSTPRYKNRWIQLTVGFKI